MQQLILWGNFPLDNGRILRLECLREEARLFARFEVNRFTWEAGLYSLTWQGCFQFQEMRQ
jgi:hypothetical protein